MTTASWIGFFCVLMLVVALLVPHGEAGTVSRAPRRGATARAARARARGQR